MRIRVNSASKGIVPAFVFVAALMALSCSGAQKDSRPVQDTGANVILITFDGVRPVDFFDQKNLPKFWAKRAKEGIIFGKPDLKSKMTIDNPAHISLPGYQNLMTGHTQPCKDNHCGRVTVETLGERLKDELDLPRGKVALIASWEKLPLAFEKDEGATFTNGGFAPLDDGSGAEDAEVKAINDQQVADRPHWKENRWDKYTIAHAMRYLKKHQPRFLYISINDTDDWAHEGKHPGVVKALKAYDDWLERLFGQLDAMGEYGKRTTVIITTDHGRGAGKNWIDHSDKLPEARDIWLYARGPTTAKLGPVKGGAHTHSDVRPTIEALMGVPPIDCATCGKPIYEIVRGQSP